jgi:hypothetical protein
MWEDIALAGSGRMHTAELLLASGHWLKGDVISRGVFGIVHKKPLDIWPPFQSWTKATPRLVFLLHRRRKRRRRSLGQSYFFLGFIAGSMLLLLFLVLFRVQMFLLCGVQCRVYEQRFTSFLPRGSWSRR